MAAKQLGKVLRELLGGTLNLMNARSSIRNELRLTTTRVASRGNNPLKFSIHVRDACARLFSGKEAGFIEPDAATREVMADLQNHEMALMAGIDAGVNAVLHELDPETMKTGVGRGLPVMGNALAKKHQEVHQRLKAEMSERTSGTFWQAFAEAYDLQIREASRRTLDRKAADGGDA